MTRWDTFAFDSCFTISIHGPLKKRGNLPGLLFLFIHLLILILPFSVQSVFIDKYQAYGLIIGYPVLDIILIAYTAIPKPDKKRAVTALHLTSGAIGDCTEFPDGQFFPTCRLLLDRSRRTQCQRPVVVSFPAVGREEFPLRACPMDLPRTQRFS